MKNQRLKIVLLFGACILLSACNSPFNNLEIQSAQIKDITNHVDYDVISQQGFMGGSVIYNADNESLGQLSKGVTIAIRFGKVERCLIDDVQAVFDDLPSQAQFGSIYIEDIGKEFISLSVKLYALDGNCLSESRYRLGLGEGIDVNDDGFYDFEYVKPSIKRTGYANASYLQFLNSKENLYTTMFAVLPEQYEGENYPNGIIGVNPDGYFILEKYSDVESGARSLVSGVYKGDYVLDNKNGTYHRITSNKYRKSCRAIEDADLEELEDNFTENYYFTEDEFIEYSKKELLAALPKSLKNGFDDNEFEINILNSILTNQNLIQIVHTEQGSIISAEDYSDVINQFLYLSENEKIKLNRMFLEHNYPSLCPKKALETSAFTEMLPLVSVSFTTINDEFDDANLPADGSRAVTASEYETQKKAIETKYKTYKQVLKQTIDIPLHKTDWKDSIKLNNSYFAIGYKGTFSSVWGNVSSSVDACVYLSLDTNMNYNRNLDVTLAEKTIPIFHNSFVIYGPIILNIDVNIKFSLPLSISKSKNIMIPCRAAISGLYSAGFSVSVKYGVNWKKWWKINYPCPYADFSGSKRHEANTIYYAGIDSPLSLDLIGIKFSIRPNVSVNVDVNISKIIHGGMFFREGFRFEISTAYSKPNLIGNAGLYLDLDIGASATIGLKDIPVIGTLGKTWDWALIKMSAPIKEWELFRKKI